MRAAPLPASSASASFACVAARALRAELLPLCGACRIDPRHGEDGVVGACAGPGGSHVTARTG
jgi:hypothetical protein